MEQKGSLLEFRALSFQYGPQPVFSGLNLSIKKGEILGLLGLSGSGKSTFLKLACGLLLPQSGEIIRHNGLVNWGYLSQGQNLIPWLTVHDNLKLVAKRNREAQQRGLEWLDKFRLAPCGHKFPYELSGGMAQKVALIRAFMQNPDVVLLDEPFSHLDLPQKEELYDFAKALWTQSSATVVIVSHDIDEVLMLTQSIYVCSQRLKNLIPAGLIGLFTTSLAELCRDPRYAGSYGQLLQHLQKELQNG